MFNETFDHETVKKLVVGFGTLFNEIYLIRKDAARAESYRYKVPIVYAPKQKYLSRSISDLPQDKQVAITYPRMSYFITSMAYDGTRKLPSTGRIIRQTDLETRKEQYNPVPYNFTIELYIIAKNAEDAFQIVTRILPFFNPSYTITINAIADTEIKEDIPIELTGTSFEDPYEGSLEERRDITYTLTFTTRLNIYGPVREQKAIRKVQVDLLIPVGVEEITDEVVATTPRTVRIITEPDPLNAIPSDDFGFSTTITEYDDNMKFNPSTLQDEPIEEDG